MAFESSIKHSTDLSEKHGVDATQEPEHGADDVIDGEQKEYPSGPKLVLILIACALAVFLVALDNTIISTAIPRIADEFRSLDDIGWYGSAFFVTTAAFQSMWGKAYKYFPVKLDYLISILIFEVGSVICAAAPNSTALIIGRAIAGVGGAGISTGSYLIIALVAPPKKMAALQGVVSASFTIASIAGPLVGGAFTQNLSWRWCFWINLPVGVFVIAFVLVFYSTPAHGAATKAPWTQKLDQMDLPGIVLLTGAVTATLLALQWGGITKSWRSGDVIGTLVAASIISIIYVVMEVKLGERATLNMRLLRDRPITFQMAHQVCVCSAFFIMLYYLPLYFQTVAGVNPAQSGIRIIPLIACGSIFSIVAGLIISYTREFQLVMIVGNSLLTIGSGLVYTLGTQSPTKNWVGYQVILGTGLGLSVQVAIIVCQSIVNIADLSTVSAMALFFQLFAGAVFLSVGQSVFGNVLIQRLSASFGSTRAAYLFAEGPTQLHTLLSSLEVEIGVDAYLSAIRAAYTVSIALGGIGTVLAVVGFLSCRQNLKSK